MGAGLARFNEQQTGINDVRPLAVLIADPESGEVVGGLIGRTSLGLMFIDLVYIPETFRGMRVGSDMLAMAEAEARRRGCCSVVLVTISFQAPGFYAKHGYTEIGRVPVPSAGHQPRPDVEGAIAVLYMICVATSPLPSVARA